MSRHNHLHPYGIHMQYLLRVSPYFGCWNPHSLVHSMENPRCFPPTPRAQEMQEGLAEQLATKVLREAEEQILAACGNEELVHSIPPL